MWIDTTTTVSYSPKVLGNRVSDKWWVVLEADEELGKYLRHLFYLASHKTTKLIRPAWKEHITVVRDEEPPTEHLKSFWEKRPGQNLWTRLFLTPETNGVYWWLPVYCEGALNIRQQLGLSRQPKIPLHMTFGHTGELNGGS